MHKPLMARKTADGRLQTLHDHLHETGLLAEGFETWYSDTARLVGEIHDLGKASQSFQRYLLLGEGKRGEIPHAKQGAFEISELNAGDGCFGELTQDMTEAIVASHHGDLPDFLDAEGQYSFTDEISDECKENPKYSWAEIKKNLSELQIPVQRDFERSERDGQELVKSISGYASGSSFDFAMGLYVKYMYSRLVDADRFDAMCFEKGIKPINDCVSWDVYIDHFEKYIMRFTSRSLINDMRTRISEECLKASGKPTGIYKLSVPTGGGKTLASLRFALHHAKNTGKQHIIYVSPYLTITEQTTATFREALGISVNSDSLLEHYSSVSISDDDDQRENRRLAAQRWANPFVVTTMVQFLESAMASRGTKLRKFHNMANSVIIFDEVQSLPLNMVNLFNEVVSFLSRVLGSTIVLCTATQPLIDTTRRKNLALSEEPDLIQVSEQDIAQSRRTEIIVSSEDKTVDQFADEVYKRAKEGGNCLAIVNLKSEARAVFRRLQQLNANEKFKLIHLSTSMCGAHRKYQIEYARTLLDSGEPVICVSTQLIEAGVDISFKRVVRAMAGLDSILQAAGRCNRSGESPVPQPVYVFSIRDERGLDHLPDIKDGKRITQELVYDYPAEDLQSGFMIHEFYKRYFAKKDQGSYMDYVLPDAGKGTTVYDLLSKNEAGRGSYRNRTGNEYGRAFAQAFRTAGSKFKVIDQQAKSVVVEYGQASYYLAQLQDDDFKVKLDALRHLQEYTVSLFPYEYDELSRQEALSQVDEDFDIFLLNSDFYSADYGVVLKPQGLPLEFLSI
ncbi:CRISPR-associated endonuclease/helicase Cas3 [Bifidobacterium commune]|uniref:CRISPR-associated endonuclease/helicase Cas3 n=3 Tax=Bifidobacterium commune TaxID=1505727 RepID=A0A1C4H4E5_9BIFI|nr:CRISPR-associated endonuclease/helicase Cas3 [Bifidobacterium commune]